MNRVLNPDPDSYGMDDLALVPIFVTAALVTLGGILDAVQWVTSL